MVLIWGILPPGISILDNAPVKQTLFILFLAILCSACARYTVTFNERVVYEPPTLLADYTLKDPALNQCVTETIRNRKIQQLSQLTDLRCPDAGIRILDGLEAFTSITVLDLSFNKILSVEALTGLKQLRQLNLKGSSMLDCDSTANISTGLEQLILPEHCLP
ncbi:MAG TPA: hypothetical protein DCF62_02575 [Porticoccaceae bacterium]|nr:hypothetical protein [Porticoccaceae bacterium]HCO59785.1 hypothetical protein [Porticoccaceae bacterium]